MKYYVNSQFGTCKITIIESLIIHYRYRKINIDSLIDEINTIHLLDKRNGDSGKDDK